MPLFKKFRDRSTGAIYSHLPIMSSATGPPMEMMESGTYTHHPQPPHPAFNPGQVTQFVGLYPVSFGNIPQPTVHMSPTQPTAAAPPYGAGPPQQIDPGQELHMHASASVAQPEPVPINA